MITARYFSVLDFNNDKIVRSFHEADRETSGKSGATDGKKSDFYYFPHYWFYGAFRREDEEENIGKQKRWFVI